MNWKRQEGMEGYPEISSSIFFIFKIFLEMALCDQRE